MSFSTILGSILNAVLSTGKEAATVAKDVGVSSVKVGSETVSISAIITELETLSKLDFNSVLHPGDFTSAKAFLMSQAFDTDVVAVADILGAVGLVFPPAAVASNYVRYVAMGISGVQAAIRIGSALDLFADLVPDGAGGHVTQAWIDDPRHKLNADGSFAN